MAVEAIQKWMMPLFDTVTPGTNGCMVSTAASARRRSSGSVRASASLKRLCRETQTALGEPVLIEFSGGCGFPLQRAAGMSSGATAIALEAGFRDGEGGGGRAQVLEADLLQGMGEEPALELDTGLDGAFARLQFVQGGFGAIDEGFVVEDRGFESRDEFKEVGLNFDEVGEEIGILRDQGTELIEEQLLGLQLLAECKPWVAVPRASSRRGPGATRHRIWRSPWRGSLPDAGNSMWSA